MRHPLLFCCLASCLTLVACGKGPDSAPLPDKATPPRVATTTPVGSTTPAARSLTPAQIATGIEAIEFDDITKLGVTFTRPNCDDNAQRDGWVVRCRIGVKDSQRKEPGLVEIQMWDRNLVFSEMVAGFEKTIDAMSRGSRLATKPDVTVTSKEGVVTHLDIVCGQAAEPIGLGMCILEPNPRMMIIAATHPASRSTVGNEDMDRSFGAIMAVVTQMQSLARP